MHHLTSANVDAMVVITPTRHDKWAPGGALSEMNEPLETQDTVSPYLKIF